MFAVRFPDEIDARLKRLSRETNRPMSFYVRDAVAKYLDDFEDLYLAEKRFIDYRAGRSNTIPLSEVMKQYAVES